MQRMNFGGGESPRIAFYGNQWALGELPRRPASRDWSFEECLEKLAAAGYDGCQAYLEYADRVRAAGLRFCTSSRINTPAEAEPSIAAAADVGADCLTVHAGWGMESDSEIDALADAIIRSADKHHLPVYIETHRATMTQDVYRTGLLLARHPKLNINADVSHCYCGQEMTYRGFALTRRDLSPILARTGFIHARISDAECMQCDITDPKNKQHVENFVQLWTEAMTNWKSGAIPGDVLIFAPELGPPSSGYSISVRDADGKSVEVCDRWEQSLQLRELGRRAFESAGNSL